MSNSEKQSFPRRFIRMLKSRLQMGMWHMLLSIGHSRKGFRQPQGNDGERPKVQMMSLHRRVHVQSGRSRRSRCQTSSTCQCCELRCLLTAASRSRTTPWRRGFASFTTTVWAACNASHRRFRSTARPNRLADACFGHGVSSSALV